MRSDPRKCAGRATGSISAEPGREPAWLARPSTALWLLAPHALAALSFVAGFGLVAIAGTSRLYAGAILGATGSLLGILAIGATVLSTIGVALASGRRRWSLLVAHLAAVAVVVALGLGWLAMHIA